MEYVYEVAAEFNNATEYPAAAIGNRLGDGLITTQIISTSGGGVSGDSLILSASYYGQVILDTVYSDSDGNVEFRNLPYSTEGITYTISVAGDKKNYFDSERTLVLDNSVSKGSAGVFVNTKTRTIKGHILNENCKNGCARESVEVTLSALEINSNNYVDKEQVKTDAEGSFNLSIPYDLSGYSNFRIKIKDHSQNELGQPRDSLYFEYLEGESMDFLPSDSSLVVTLDPKELQKTRLTEVEIYDVISHPLHVVIAGPGSCNIFEGYEFLVRVTDGHGKLDELIWTEGQSITENYPPYSLTIQIVDVNKKDAYSQSVLDYFRTQRMTVDNISNYKEYLNSQRQSLFDTTWYFRYSERADLTIKNLSDIQYCNMYVLDADGATEGVASTVTLEAVPYQVINGNSCLATSGYILPRFPGGEFDLDTLRYMNGTWESVELTATSANLTFPYTQLLEFYYYDDNDNYQGLATEEILVLGKKSQEGNDVFVIPKTNNRMLVPLYVLRDPPGDKSSAFISEKSVLSFTLNTKESHSGGSSVSSDFSLEALGGLLQLTGGIDIGGGDTYKKNRGYELEFKESLSTASGAKISENLEGYLDGPDADIVVGMSVIMSYGVVENLSFRNGCEIDKSMTLTVDPNQISSTWAYTRSQIKNTIRYYDRLVQKNANGRYETTDDVNFEVNELSATADAVGNIKDIPEQIGIAKELFEGLLEDMDSKFTPVCEMCQYASLKGKYTYNQVGLSSIKDKAKSLLSDVKEFCHNSMFQSQSEECIPMSDLIGAWTESDREIYRKHYRKFLAAKEIIKFYSKEVYPFSHQDDRFEDILLGNLKKIELFDPLENITFGAGSKVSRVSEATSTYFKSTASEAYISPNATLNVGVIQTAKVSHWVGVGGGVEATLTTMGSKSVAVVKSHYKYRTEVSNDQFSLSEFKTGFTLNDDDDGDHFSIDVYHSWTDGATSTTPYFNLVGGRSSCPYEAGTLSRDVPTVQLADEHGTLYPTKMYDLNPDVRIDIPVAVSSGNLFGEQREIQVTSPLGSNKYGLKMEMENVRVSNYRGNVVLTQPDEDAYFSYISFQKGNSPYYDFEDIQILVKPNCNYRKGTYWEEAHIFDTLNVELHFRKPTSEVVIGDHMGGIVITADTDESDAINEEQATIRLLGYDVEQVTYSLKEIYMEYKRVGDEYWNRVRDASTGLDALSVDTLYYQFKKKLNTYIKPEYPFVWDISTMDDLVDGQYQLRATAVHDKGTYFNYSNVLMATIDRTPPELAANTMPSDSVLSFGEEVSATFTEEIDKEHFDKHGNIRVEILDYNGEDITLAHHEEFEVLSAYEYFWSGNNIGVVVKDDTLKKYDGKKIKVTLSGIRDIYGNASDPQYISWSFYIDYYNRDASKLSILSSSAYVVNTSNMADLFSVVITDFDVYTVETGLDSIEVSYKHKTQNDWIVIDSRTQGELEEHYQMYQDNQETPLDTVFFSFSGLRDGEYAIRATAYSGLNVNYSNEVVIYKDTLAPQLLGVPQPDDSVYSLGDEVSMSFSEHIDCNYSLDYKVAVTQDGKTDTLQNVEANCYYNGLVLFTMDDEDLRRYFGARATIYLSNVVDDYGNITDSVTYSFVIDNTSSPTSSAKLLDPNDGWVINSEDTSVTLILEHYDLFGINSVLDSIVIQYRHLQDHSWTQFDVITFQQLKDAYDYSINAYDPEYTFEFHLDTAIAQDGHYGVRGIVYGNGYANHSNFVVGMVDLTPIRLAQSLVDLDRDVYSDELMVISFTEPIDLTTINDSTLVITQESVGGTNLIGSASRSMESGGFVVDPDYYTLSTDGNDLVIDYKHEFYEEFADLTMKIALGGAKDENGNTLEEPLTYNFTVLNRTTQKEDTASMSLGINGSNLRGTFHANGVVELNWDANVKYTQYSIERSFLGHNFNNLAFVRAMDTDEYQYLDHVDFNDFAFYRLNQIDYEGNALYSKVIIVHKGALIQPFSTLVYPNPVWDYQFNLMVNTSDTNQDVYLKLYDLSGSEVFSKEISLSDLGNPIHQIELERNLNAGIYSLQVRQGAVTEYHKLVITNQ